jgi:hypothetical protein
MYTINAPYTNVSTFGYNLLNRPHYDTGIFGQQAYAYFTPFPAWRKINSITIYTNLSSSVYNQVPTLNFNFIAGSDINYYQAGTNIYDEAALIQPGNIFPAAVENFYTNVTNPFLVDVGLPANSWGGAFNEFFSLTQGGTINQVPGTLTPANPGYTPISATDFTGYLSANPGDPGTTYYTSTLFNVIGKGCGIKYLGTVNTPSVFGVNALDVYSHITMGVYYALPKTTYINGLKLQIVIDYEELI